MKFIYIWLFLNITCFAQSIDFFRENIEIELHDHSVSLNGTYYFRNASELPISVLLNYPFIVNDSLPFPDSITVFDRIHSAPIKHSNSSSAIIFPLEMPAKSIIIIDIFFNQKAIYNEFEYILLTTQKWHKPLELANFKIVVPARLKLNDTSFPFQETTSDEKMTCFSLNKRNFMPQKNLSIVWEVKK